MKRNKTAFCAVILAFCLSMTFVLQPSPAQAASKPATDSNGKYLYYPCLYNIYRMDTATGKNTVISKRQAGYTQGTQNISYHKGYLYWSPSGQEIGPVLRMNAKGGKIQTLAEFGHAPVVSDNKIYYYDGYSSDRICRMDLDGKNKKTIISEPGRSAYCSFQILNNRIYYPVNGFGAYGSESCLYSADLSGKGSRRETSEIINQLCSDGKDIYYTTENAVYRLSGKTGKHTKLPKLSWPKDRYTTRILDVYNGVIYFADNSGGLSKLKKYVVSKGTTATLKTFKKGYTVTSMWAGQGSYAALSIEILTDNPKEVQARIKKDGKGYKALKTGYIM